MSITPTALVLPFLDRTSGRAIPRTTRHDNTSPRDHIHPRLRQRMLAEASHRWHDAAQTEDRRASALATLIELEPDDMVRDIYVEQANRILWSAAHG